LSGSRVGGFVGYNSSTTITDCYSTGNVASSGPRVGGFVGFNRSSATITDCYSTGNVSSSGTYSGGFVGYNYNSAAITTSFSYGLLSGAGGGKGGFCGKLDDATFSDCYWNSTGQPAGLLDIGSPSGDNDDITALTAAEFKDKSNFEGWDFASTWDVGVQYPILRTFDININGFVGENLGTITNSYWDTTRSTVATDPSATGLDSSGMAVQATFTTAGWNFSTVWRMLLYPVLRIFDEIVGPSGRFGSNTDRFGTNNIDRFKTAFISRFNKNSDRFGE
jgi:hypothetical protein